MKAKPLVLRQAAAQQIEQVVDYYLQEGGSRLALRFIADLETAYRHLRLYPATGSLRYASELGITGLRFWALTDFPYLIFYVERHDAVDVLVILHAQRDIPHWLAVGLDNNLK